MCVPHIRILKTIQCKLKSFFLSILKNQALFEKGKRGGTLFQTGLGSLPSASSDEERLRLPYPKIISLWYRRALWDAIFVSDQRVHEEQKILFTYYLFQNKRGESSIRRLGEKSHPQSKATKMGD